ncbi:uncharacterized protein [Euwallacea similis]|uniref:uncharacterized protein n=1 Tax=Euwallacea similis TaxID=1736056 RepID=UPI00344D6239
MLKYTPDQVASIIALPLTGILLFWTVVIFHKNRRKWGPYDIPIVAILVLNTLRNTTILAYILAAIFNFNTEYCGIITWIFNSIHTFQASCLTSIAVIGLFSAKLHRKNQNLRTFLTSTHIVYHLFCLTTLCACVGVAAILAQKSGDVFASENFDVSPCDFLPFQLDIKFNVFIIVLHVFLASISFTCFVAICYNYYKTKQRGFDYIKKSNSDLSELSNNFHGINGNVTAENRNFYDTYTISRNDNNNYKDTWSNERHFTTNSEVLSNNSTTVSSTNSRRPCIVKPRQEEEEEERDVRRTGLETMHPVLIVCYLFYHLPVIILCIYPRLIYPWSVAGIALWLGLVQDLLIPVGLGIVDSRFCGWVSNVYRCSAKHKDEKLPQVGLDGKFRPFGLSSQPQSLDLSHQERSKTLQQMEHRFPITNGSLYTSIDGRLPVIHNYRRHKEFRTGTLKQQEVQSSNVALHSSHLHRRDLEENPLQKKKYSSCTNCSMDHCPSHSDLHHLTPQRVQRKLSFLQVSQNNVFACNGERKEAQSSCLFVGNKRLQNTQNSLQRNQIRLLENSRLRSPGKRLSQSQESINHLFFENGTGYKLGDTMVYHNSDINVSSPHQRLMNNNLLRLNKMRLSRSEDSIKDIQILETPPQKFIQKIDYQDQDINQYSSDDEDSTFFNHNGSIAKDYDSMSSSNSITTEANCDFEFFQTQDSSRANAANNPFENNNPKGANREKVKHVSNIRITRSNSRRSLENLQTFIEESLDLESKIKNNENVSNKVVILQRSNSYTTLEDKKRKRKVKRTMSRSNSKTSESVKIDNFQSQLLDMRNKKVKSVEYLPHFTNHAVYIEDLKNNNNMKSVGRSVPDFKKVFISDYI